MAHTAISEKGTMAVYQYQRCQMKQFSLRQNHTSYKMRQVFIENLPDYKVVFLVADGNFSIYYNKNYFNLTTFGVSRMELKRNGMSVPRYCYTSDFTINHTMKLT